MLSLSYHNCSAVGGRRVNMILHALPNQGGGGVLCRWRLTMAEAEEKREVGSNCEEV